MWRIKKEYKGKKIGVSGFGFLDFEKESAETIHKLSLLPQFRILIKYIEKDVTEKTTHTTSTTSKAKKSKSKFFDKE